MKLNSFIKLADSIHAYSLKFHNGKVIAISNPFLIEKTIDFKVPDLEITRFTNLLVFDELNEDSFKIDENQLIIEQGNIKLITPYIELDLKDLEDYKVPENKDYICNIEDQVILDKLNEIYKLTKAQIYLNANDIECYADNNTFNIKHECSAKNKIEDSIELTELFKLGQDWLALKIANGVITGITEDAIVHYFRA